MVPGLLHAGNYCGTNHWLKAVKAAGTTEGEAVVKKMKEMPVNDFYNKNVKVREDGRVLHEMYLWEVKNSSESKDKYRPLQDGRLGPWRRRLSTAQGRRVLLRQSLIRLRHVVARTQPWLRANGRVHASAGPFTSLEPSPCRSNTMLYTAIASPRPDIGSPTGRSVTLH